MENSVSMTDKRLGQRSMSLLAKTYQRVCFVVLVVVCIVLTSCKDTPQQQSRGSYKTMEITQGSRTVTSKYSASVRGKQNVDIRPQISGLITQICIDEGASVKKGQTLFIIDQVSYKAALETAVANVASAEAKVATAQLVAESKVQLFNENVISEFDLKTAQNSLREAQAALAQAKAGEVNARNSLSYTVVKSPVDGVASMIPYKVGTLVSPSIAQPLVEVSNEDEMCLYFSMTENQILALTQQEGTLAAAIKNMPAVKLELSNGTLYQTEGKIDAISGTIDPHTGAVSVRAIFANPKRILRNGGMAVVVMPYEKTDCIVIPKSATYEIQDKVFVYKVVEGKATSAEITTFKIDNGTEYIVESGLALGDIIVAEGAGLIREGTEIQTNKQ